MGWQELRIEIDAEHCELIEGELTKLGALAITLNDAGDEPVLEPLPGETPVWPRLWLTALFEKEQKRPPIETLLHQLWPQLKPRWQELADQHWERLWLDRFKPRKFGRRLWVIPSGSVPPDKSGINIYMDPGLAFGTGDHATTSLCMEWLDGALLRGKTVLDYGHGSGILSIAAHQLGASDVVGIDIDPQAVLAGHDNARRNEISQGIRFLLSDIDQQFDTVVANILAGPLIIMASKLSGYLRPDGDIALSGILEQQANRVQKAFEPWVDWQGLRQRDGWVLLYGTRNAVSIEGCEELENTAHVNAPQRNTPE